MQLKSLLLIVMLLTGAAIAWGDPAADQYARGLAAQNKGDLDGAIASYSHAIELKPDFADAHNSRGVAKNGKGDLNGAIADYDRAILLQPDSWPAYNNRGLAKKAKEDLDGAIADYTKAIQLKPDYGHAYGNRGDAKQALGDLPGAIADYSKVIELNPKSPEARDSRGCLHYEARSFADALSDYRAAIALRSSDDNPYTHFWIWLVRARQGEAEPATAELQKYLAERARRKSNDWPANVGQFLMGRLAEIEFLVAAKNADSKIEAGQLCEAFFYAGSKHLLAGDAAGAAACFQKAIATDKKSFFEYAAARAELKFLGRKQK